MNRGIVEKFPQSSHNFSIYFGDYVIQCVHLHLTICVYQSGSQTVYASDCELGGCVVMSYCNYVPIY